MSLFRDARLDNRLEKLKAAMRQTNTVCLPEILKDWSDLKAGYRFLK